MEYPRDRSRLEKLFASSGESNPKVIETVSRIIEEVRRRGNTAVCEYGLKLDGAKLKPAQLRLPVKSLEEAWTALPRDLQQALRLAKRRVEAFHRRQARRSWTLHDKAGLNLSQRWAPLQRVGVYIPGGTAAYPSTVLMNVIPARMARVPEIVAVTPPAREGVFNAAILGALFLCGVEEVYQIGGAQAIAALALGTQTIRPVDKIVGPGNAYVAAAKRLLYGTIDIDSIAGPSEVMILADETAPTSWIAADLLAQAEHSPDAQSIAVLIGKAGAPKCIEALQSEIARQTQAAPRAAIVRQSLRERGALVRVKDRAAAVEIANLKAPEHLEIAAEQPRELMQAIHHAGSIFLGLHTPEPLGDYVAGPNHVLPTGGTARFASPLSVDDFMKMTQIIEAAPKGLKVLSRATIQLAEAEGLFAHANSVRIRQESQG